MGSGDDFLNVIYHALIEFVKIMFASLVESMKMMFDMMKKGGK